MANYQRGHNKREGETERKSEGVQGGREGEGESREREERCVNEIREVKKVQDVVQLSPMG